MNAPFKIENVKKARYETKLELFDKHLHHNLNYKL